MADKKSSDAKRSKPEETDPQSPNDEARPEPDTSEDDLITEKIQQILKEQGIDAETMETLGQQVLKEMAALQKEKPLVLLLGAFALGCVIGRTLK